MLLEILSDGEMQTIFERLLVGLVGAVSIIIVLIIIGMIMAHQEELKRRRIDVYAKAIYLIVATAIAIYLFLTGALLPNDVLLLSVFAILFICISDWTWLKRKPDSEGS